MRGPAGRARGSHPGIPSCSGRTRVDSDQAGGADAFAGTRFNYTAEQKPAKACLYLVSLTQLLIALPLGLGLLWAAWWLHRRMFRRPGEGMSVLDAVVLVLMAGMGLLIALSLWTALG